MKQMKMEMKKRSARGSKGSYFHETHVGRLEPDFLAFKQDSRILSVFG